MNSFESIYCFFLLRWQIGCYLINERSKKFCRENKLRNVVVFTFQSRVRRRIWLRQIITSTHIHPRRINLSQLYSAYASCSSYFVVLACPLSPSKLNARDLRSDVSVHLSTSSAFWGLHPARWRHQLQLLERFLVQQPSSSGSSRATIWAVGIFPSEVSSSSAQKLALLPQKLPG